jgi:repressor LexA
MHDITKKQKETLEAVEKLSALLSRPPTLRELQEFLGYGSTSSVQRHTDALKGKGFLRAEKFQKRGLIVPQRSSERISPIPLLGNIACGQPILAVENIEAYIPLKVQGDPKEYFCLRAVGNSMDKAGIEDGDIVLIRQQSTAENGDAVVALLGEDATIKILRKELNRIVLEPRSSDPSNKPIYVFGDPLIQGKVIKTIKYAHENS